MNSLIQRLSPQIFSRRRRRKYHEPFYTGVRPACPIYHDLGRSEYFIFSGMRGRKRFPLPFGISFAVAIARHLPVAGSIAVADRFRPCRRHRQCEGGAKSGQSIRVTVGYIRAKCARTKFGHVTRRPHFSVCTDGEKGKNTSGSGRDVGKSWQVTIRPRAGPRPHL